MKTGLLAGFFCWFLLYSITSLAGATPGASHSAVASRLAFDEAADLIKRDSLDQDETWHNLMVYESSRFKKGVRSAILSDGFFLSPHGKVDPASELRATLAAFFTAPGTNHNDHPVCVFRGRYEWLVSRIPSLRDSLPQLDCEEFYDWSMNGSIKSISIVLASGYLGNPASYYGHTLIKFNPDKKTASQNQVGNTFYSTLLDTSVNFGAQVPDSENPVHYILRGLFGGYDAGFSHIHYGHHTHLYGEIELRDLWEYELEMNENQLNIVVGHLWELMGQRYQYFFLNRNCAYRMGEVFELLDGVSVVDQNALWAMPQEMIMNLYAEKNNNSPLISNTTYRPSRQGRLYQRYTQLSWSERQFVNDAIATKSTAPLEDAALDDEAAVAITDTLLDYYRYAMASGVVDKVGGEAAYNDVLRRRYALPPGRQQRELEIVPQEPHGGRRASLTQVGLVSAEGGSSALEITLRPAYYDVLDGEAAHVEGSQLIMGRVSARLMSDGAEITNLDIFNVQNNSYLKTGLPGDDGRSWRLSAGLVTDNLACESCPTLQGVGSIGKTAAFEENLGMGFFFGGIVQDNSYGQGNFAATATLSAYGRLSSRLNFKIEYELRSLLDERGKQEHRIKFESRYKISSNSDIRFYYRDMKKAEAGILLGFYW